MIKNLKRIKTPSAIMTSWSDTVTVRHLGQVVMQWRVLGDGYDASVDAVVEKSPEWAFFLAWRQGVPEPERKHIVLEHMLRGGTQKNCGA